jgi:predicted transcriptional regulator
MPYGKRPIWSREEEGRAAEWRAAGLSLSEIAARLGRSETAVRNRVQTRVDPSKQIEKIPAEVLADRDARAQARFDAHEADPLSLFFGDPVRPRTQHNE